MCLSVIFVTIEFTDKCFLSITVCYLFKTHLGEWRLLPRIWPMDECFPFSLSLLFWHISQNADFQCKHNPVAPLLSRDLEFLEGIMARSDHKTLKAQLKSEYSALVPSSSPSFWQSGPWQLFVLLVVPERTIHYLLFLEYVHIPCNGVRNTHLTT